MPSFRVVGACGPHAVKATLQALAMLAALPALLRSFAAGLVGLHAQIRTTKGKT